MLIMTFTQSSEWTTIHQKCRPVPGKDSLDAEIGGCSMLIESLNQWVTQRVNVQLSSTVVSPAHLHCIFVGMLCTRVDRDRAPHPSVDLWVSSASGVRCFVVRMVCGRGLGVQSVM